MRGYPNLRIEIIKSFSGIYLRALGLSAAERFRERLAHALNPICRPKFLSTGDLNLAENRVITGIRGNLAFSLSVPTVFRNKAFRFGTVGTEHETPVFTGFSKFVPGVPTAFRKISGTEH